MIDEDDISEEDMIEIKRREDIPSHFENEDDEADFWSTHYFGEEYRRRYGRAPRAKLPAFRLRQHAETRRPT